MNEQTNRNDLLPIFLSISNCKIECIVRYENGLMKRRYVYNSGGACEGRFEYDSYGNLIAECNACGTPRRTYKYDSYGNRVEINWHDDHGQIRATYDENYKLRASYDYDSEGNLIKEEH